MDFGFPWSRNRFRAALAPLLDDGPPLPGMPGWGVLATPGHADDAICLYHRKAAFLVAGDTARNFLGGEWNPIVTCRKQFSQTRRRLRRLPVSLVGPGHGPMLEGNDIIHRLHRVRPWEP